MQLRAVEHGPMGATQNYLGASGDAPRVLEAMPVASMVDIIEDPGGFILFGRFLLAKQEEETTRT